MDSDSGKGWILIVALILLGVGIALYLAKKASEARDQERRALEMHRAVSEQQVLLEQQRDELEVLRVQLENERRRC